MSKLNFLTLVTDTHVFFMAVIIVRISGELLIELCRQKDVGYSNFLRVKEKLIFYLLVQQSRKLGFYTLLAHLERNIDLCCIHYPLI